MDPPTWQSAPNVQRVATRMRRGSVVLAIVAATAACGGHKVANRYCVSGTMPVGGELDVLVERAVRVPARSSGLSWRVNVLAVEDQSRSTLLVELSGGSSSEVLALADSVRGEIVASELFLRLGACIP